ncbi:MAG TPA: aminopeptidase [Bacteroidia bacterium]|nr:aminopeptidase [Bacteroidia bacterium]
MRKFLRFIFIAVAVYLLWNIHFLIYGFLQLSGQLSLNWSSVPVSAYISSPDSDSLYREKLLYITKVRAFAIDSLGLHKSSNYTKFYNQHDKPVLWVVTGCRPFSLEAKSWTYPILGQLPYKGFFDEKRAIKEAQCIRNEGYESDIYCPEAWSTLGFLSDPVLSGQLKRGPGQLAELIIHELTHSTLFLADSADFNENFATLVGEQGAIAFLSHYYGDASPEKIKYTHLLEDEKIYTDHIMHGAMQLDSLYNTFGSGKSFIEKCELKYKLIGKILTEIIYLPLHHKENYLFDFKNKKLPDNTWFMGFMRYRKNQQTLSLQLHNKYNNNLKLMLTDYTKNNR